MSDDRFYGPIKGPKPATPGFRAYLAGRLVAACADLGTRFEGDVGGWRIVVDKVTEHRRMVSEDIGLPWDFDYMDDIYERTA